MSGSVASLETERGDEGGLSGDRATSQQTGKEEDALGFTSNSALL
eukprot:CAMPEP_0115669314 /NCGR_PEP_ID=MMETSP0272-20121206/50933_1 /TAXON_ID=71861 /ORGANISM="Scrippsiella trochoidea, Strain CCMP3099" /LENGTH=44 /DNA_ID= /DNA_START= /DNA_END= /DNA_ORIENTATION=